LLDELTSRQLSEWEAYDTLDPIGTWREDIRFAKLMSLLQNFVSAIYKKEEDEVKYSTPLDFMPIWDVEEAKKKEEEKVQVQNAEELKNALMSFTQVHNAQVEAKEQPIKNRNIKFKKPPNFRHHGRH
jgi:hypothetical protein